MRRFIQTVEVLEEKQSFRRVVNVGAWVLFDPYHSYWDML
jgi:hypothetical protein